MVFRVFAQNSEMRQATILFYIVCRSVIWTNINIHNIIIYNFFILFILNSIILLSMVVII